jgi:uncharacterized protein YxjI
MPYRLELRQHFTVMVNRWDLSRTAPDQAQLGFIEQKRMSLREKVTCWTDNSRGSVLFTIQAENIIELAGKYVVADGAGQQLARIEKDFRGSLAQSTYHLRTPAGVFVVRERGRLRAILRRVWGLVVDWPWLLPIQFEVVREDGAAAGSIQRQWSRLRDVYDVDVHDDGLDQRVAAAAAVAVDAFMNR